jgi:lysophospholipid hydrolase
MAALFAQGLSWEAMHALVRRYAAAMGSARHLLADLTLPLISVFSGAGFDRIVRDTFATGAQRIEDLWLRRAPPSPPSPPPPPISWLRLRVHRA